MADDIKAENYKKSVEKIVNNWASKVNPLFKQLAPVLADLDRLNATKDPGQDDKKKIDDLKKKCADIRKQIEKANTELRIDLMLIEVPPKADDKELVKLPAWFKEIVKKKGIPLSEHWTLKGDLDIDIKKKKVNSASIILEWEW
jgi:hypothetical protein